MSTETGALAGIKRKMNAPVGSIHNTERNITHPINNSLIFSLNVVFTHFHRSTHIHCKKKKMLNCLQLTCSMLHHCAVCTVTMNQSLVESILEKIKEVFFCSDIPTSYYPSFIHIINQFIYKINFTSTNVSLFEFLEFNNLTLIIVIFPLFFLEEGKPHNNLCHKISPSISLCSSHQSLNQWLQHFHQKELSSTFFLQTMNYAMIEFLVVSVNLFPQRFDHHGETIIKYKIEQIGVRGAPRLYKVVRNVQLNKALYTYFYHPLIAGLTECNKLIIDVLKLCKMLLKLQLIPVLISFLFLLFLESSYVELPCIHQVACLLYVTSNNSFLHDVFLPCLSLLFDSKLITSIQISLRNLVLSTLTVPLISLISHIAHLLLNFHLNKSEKSPLLISYIVIGRKNYTKSITESPAMKMLVGSSDERSVAFFHARLELFPGLLYGLERRVWIMFGHHPFLPTSQIVAAAAPGSVVLLQHGARHLCAGSSEHTPYKTEVCFSPGFHHSNPLAHSVHNSLIPKPS
ncbi:hypothetical protein VP01_1862g1 [Puccinia sorghi]|uniref:Uncharacterized protein n=1 Tax=Puccinia sorghi TaxID=27349 RepID=A0A0L6VDY4_9BASI|nr:hypothetical protein VP01_1862g1 [Puccinia sorghi]